MSTETLPQPKRRFIPGGLPWAIAAAGLLAYLATLNHWLTFGSLPLAAEIGDWRWQPMLEQPVLFLLTWPLRWLPARWMPPGLNVLAALCASLTLALLARSVGLLAQDPLEGQDGVVRSGQPQLSRPRAWVPPVLAALALGLQLTFWENATAAPGEMVELLLFAAVVWCLLEYRCDPRLGWLDRACFIYGVALANSWAIAGFLPLLAVALIWSKRLRFFNVRFLQHIEASAWRKAIPALASDSRFFLRMVLFGLAGLSLIILLPLVNGLSPDSPLSFWQALSGVAGSYKTILLLLAKVFRYHRDVVLLLLAVSLVPVLILSIRWRLLSDQGSTRRLDLVPLISYAAHAFLLALCISVAFDPPFSPRQLSSRLGVPLPFLPLYYLNALSVGYYGGFFLGIFGATPSRRRVLLRALHWTVPKLLYGLLGLMLAGLLWKNLPTIHVANGRQLEQYARFMVDSLPPEGAVVLGYDPARLALLQGGLGRGGKAGRYVAVDGNALGSEGYRAWLKKRYPKQWTEPAAVPTPGEPARPGSATSSPLDVRGFLRLMAWLAQSNSVCYLEANYGLLAEQFYSQPHDLVYELKAYPTNAFSGPPLTAGELAESEAFWKRVIETGVDPLASVFHDAEQPPHGLAARLMKRAHITRPVPDVTRVLARWYSGALNGWGVSLQRQDHWQAATPCFVKAVELNPDNLPARVNLQCNTNRLAGKELTLASPESIKEQLEKYRSNWAQVLTADGPMDDPTYCFWLGVGCAHQNLRRQAGQQLERAQALAPKEISPRLALGDLLSDCRMPDRALQLAAGIQADLSRQPPGPNLNVELAFMEAKAWFAKTNQAKALGILRSLLDSNPGDSALLDRIKAVFVAVGSYTNALRVTDQELRSEPDNIPNLLDRGLLYLVAGEFSNAIPAFTRVLTLTNSYPALMYRARAYLQTTQLDAAMTNYQEALRAFPASYQPYYGLAEVAARRGDTNAASRYEQQGLSNAVLVADQQVQRTPDNVQALMDKGVLLARAGKYSNAIPVFTRVLSLTNMYGGRLFRSLAYLETRQWDAAEADCRELLRLFPAAYQPYSALAEVALRRGNTNAAIQRYQQYLSKAPTNQADFRAVAARLKSLQTQAQ